MGIFIFKNQDNLNLSAPGHTVTDTVMICDDTKTKKIPQGYKICDCASNAGHCDSNAGHWEKSLDTRSTSDNFASSKAREKK